MLLSIDPSLDLPIYTQIVNQVIIGIAKGTLTHGFQLPSVRSLASDLDINMHTVNKAYKILGEQGYVTMIPKKGVTIKTDRDENNDLEPSFDELELALAKVKLTGLSHQKIKELVGNILIDFKEEPS